MERITLLLLFLLNAALISGQQKAITDKGEEVLLYENGTWKYLNDSISNNIEIPLNPQSYSKDRNSRFVIKCERSNYTIALDPKKWTFRKSTSNPDAEYEFELKGQDLYGMIINEKIEIPLESLRSIAFENAQNVSKDIEIAKEEYRIVNGKKMLMMQLNGTIRGIKFSYLGYYHSNPNGTIQFITYSSQSLMEELMAESEKLLNGLEQNVD